MLAVTRLHLVLSSNYRLIDFYGLPLYIPNAWYKPTNYIALDSNGDVWLYAERPEFHAGIWDADGDKLKVGDISSVYSVELIDDFIKEMTSNSCTPVTDLE